jgi:hypothetical protein
MCGSSKSTFVGMGHVRYTRAEAQSCLQFSQHASGWQFGPVQRITDAPYFDAAPSMVQSSGQTDRICANRTCRKKTDVGKPCWNCGAP